MIHYRQKHDAASSHQQVVQMIRQICAGPVLDVGSAQGILGQALASSGLIIDAIEPDADWAEAARPYYRTVSNCPIETAVLPIGHYKTIVCADVLEHLAHPGDALSRLRKAASSDATFIVSVPNVAHFSTRLLLLFGHFPRLERGILDKTHLQFFTRSTIISLLASVGLTVTQVRATPIPLEELTQSRSVIVAGRVFQRMMLRLLPTIFAYQWILVAQGRDG